MTHDPNNLSSTPPPSEDEVERTGFFALAGDCEAMDTHEKDTAALSKDAAPTFDPYAHSDGSRECRPTTGPFAAKQEPDERAPIIQRLASAVLELSTECRDRDGLSDATEIAVDMADDLLRRAAPSEPDERTVTNAWLNTVDDPDDGGTDHLEQQP